MVICCKAGVGPYCASCKESKPHERHFYVNVPCTTWEVCDCGIGYEVRVRCIKAKEEEK
jgi:hypothetical protein